jgi:hypothetical protein
MKRKKRTIEPAEEERRPDAPRGKRTGQAERIEAELAGKSPGAAGLTVRSKRPKC